MFLKRTFQKRTGRTYLSIAQGYRTLDKKSRSKTIQSIGYLDELKKEYDDPIAHFTKIAKAMDTERLADKKVSITLCADERLEKGAANRKNYGHVVFSKIYHELELDRFLKNARRHEKFRFNTDAIMRLLVFCRLLYPGSKRAAILDKERFFDSFKFSLDDVYDSLDHFDKICARLLKHLHEKVTELYGRDTTLVYYDVTNYYFEIDRQDELRKNGPAKEHRKDPIVQMGLLIDKAGLPISYRLFAGNTHDSQTLMPILTEVKRKFGVKRIIAVADKGLNSGDNIAYNMILGDGYIYSKSVRGAGKRFKDWILDDRGYRIVTDKYKVKSKVFSDAPNWVSVGKVNGKNKKKNVPIEQKWVVFYAEKYALRAKHKREEAIAKAAKMIENPSQYKSAFDYGAAAYIENIKIDRETGEILNTDDTLILDEAKIAEEEKYDGYYAIVTSELDTPDEQIIDAYRGLWRIEESFKVTKSTLEARPVFLRTQEHINAHFLICFIALLIARITELRLNNRYTIAKIVETLRKVECSNIDQNLWLFDYADDVTDDMNAAFSTDFGLKMMTLKNIRKNLGLAKRG
jgi:transposase